MDFTLPEDALVLQDMLRRFVEKEARPLEMKFFTSGTLEEKDRARLRKAIEQMGLWGLMLPEAFGGGGLDTVTTCVIEQELGKTFIPLDLGDVPPLLFACKGEQVEHFLDPALAGERHAILAVREPQADGPKEWATRASFQGDTYILDGVKLLAKKPEPADFLIVFAQTPEGATTFLLDADQEGVSYQTNGNVTLHLKQCLAGAGLLLGERGQALSLEMQQAHAGWLRVGARMVGLAERLIAMSAEYANTWVVMGAPLKNRPAVQNMLAEAHVQLESVRWLVYHTAWLADQNEPLDLAVADVRLGAAEMLCRVKDLVTMIYNGPAPSQALDPQKVLSHSILAATLPVGLDSARIFIANEILQQFLAQESA